MTRNRTINLRSLVALMVGVLAVAACGATKQAANRPDAESADDPHRPPC
jgi:hypothetical protein